MAQSARLTPRLDQMAGFQVVDTEECDAARVIGPDVCKTRCNRCSVRHEWYSPYTV